jgi:hypothetical protein
MEKFKQNTWMGRGRIVLFRDGEPPIWSGEIREEEGPRFLGRSFLYHIELEDRETLHHHLAPLICGLVGVGLIPDGEQSQTIPNLSCLKIPLRDYIPKIHF